MDYGETGIFIDLNAEICEEHQPLVAAALQGDEQRCLELLEQDEELAFQAYEQVTPLFAACCNGHHEIAFIILDKAPTFDVNSTDPLGRTALHAACANGHKECLELLLEMDADLLKKDKMGRTGLHFASMYGHWHLLSIMLDEDISVLLQTDNQKRGALHLATLNKHERCVEELINLGANVVKKDIEGRSALSMAAELGAVGIAEWLLSCIEQDRKEEDDDAYDDEDDDESSKEAGGIDSRDLEGRTPFHWAAACGHAEVLLLLHQYKCDVNAQDRNGATALHLACLNSRRTCVDSLVAECFVELDLVDKHGRTVLHSAAAGTHSEGKACLELLLPGIQLQFPNLLNVQDDRGWTCLHWACFRNNAKSVALLLKYGVDHALSDYQQHNTCLHVASFHGYTKCVVVLLKATRDFAFLQALNANQDTAVHLAAANGHLDTLKELCTDWTRHVEYILEQQPQQSENGSPSSPFLRSSIVRQLNRQGSTALHLAARRGHRECLTFCLEELKTHSWLLDDGDDLGIYGNDENGEEDDDESVNNHKDFGVVEGNYPELEKGLYQKDYRGRTVFHEVCRGGHLSCLEQILTLIRGQTRDTSFAAKQKESVGLEVLLDRDKDGRTPLHLATASSTSSPSPSSSSDDETGAAGVMRLLLDFAKDKKIKTRSNNSNSSSLKEEMLRAIDRKGRTALHLAAQAGKVEPAGRILVENGAMLNPVDSFGGFTPLHLACLSDREPFACFLLDKGARLDCEDSAGRTPFQLAVLKGHIDTVTSLLQAPRPGESTDSILNQPDKQGRNSLHYAVESFASLQNKSKRGTTTEGSKRRSNDKEAEIEEESHNDDDDSPIVDPRRVITLLIQKGIALDARDRFGRTALHRAAWLGNSEVTKLLLDAYADRPALSNTVANEQQLIRASAIRATDNVTKATPLHVAAMRGHHEVLRLLMEPLLQNQKEGSSSSSSWTKAQTRGHGVDVRDGMGRTPLHWAAYHGQEKCLRLLLEEDKSGAELAAKDLKGRTALHLACFGGHTHCVERLLAYAKKEHASSPIASSTFDITPTTVDLWKRRDLEGRLPIHMAAAGGHSDIIDILINNSNNNGEEEFLDDKGWSPLHYAALGGHQQCTDHLITLMHGTTQPQQTSVEKMDKEGKTPLMLAVIAACSGHGGLFFLSNSSNDGEKREQLQTKKRKKEGGNNVEEAVDEVVNNWYNRTKSVDAVQSRLEAIQEAVKERRKKRMRKNKPNKEESNNGWRRAVSPRSKRSRLQSLFPQLDSIERLLQQGASLNRPSDKASKKTALHWGLQASLKNVNNQPTMNGFRNLRQLLLLSHEKKVETNEEIEEEMDRKELFDAYLAWKRKEQQADQETSEFEFIEASSSSISGNNSNSNSVEDELERYRAKVAQMEKALNEGEASEESEDDDDDEDKWKEWGEEVMQTIDELFNAIVLPSSTWLVCMEKLLKECETNNRVDLSLFDGEGKHVINWLNDKQAQLKIINNNKKRSSSSRQTQEQSGKDRQAVERERKMETILKKEAELEMMRLEQLIKDVRRRTAQMVLQKVNKKEEELAPKREQQMEEEIVAAKRSKEGQELGKAEQNGEEDVSSKRPRKEEKILHIFPSTEEEDEGKGKGKEKEEEKEGIETTMESEEETQEANVDMMNTAMLFDTPEALKNVGWDKLEEGKHGEGKEENGKKEEEKRTSEQEITSKEEMEDEKEDEKEQENEKEDENEIDAEKQKQEEEQTKKAESETKEEIKQTTDRDEEEIRKEEKEKQQKEEQERIDKEEQQKKIEEEQRAKEAEQKAKAEQELMAQIDQQNEALLQQWEVIKHQLHSLHTSSLSLLQQAQQQANTEKARLEEEDPRKRAEREVLELAKQKLLRRRAMRQRRAARRRAQQAKAQSNATHWTVMIAVFLALWFVWCVVGGGGSGTGLQSRYSSSPSSSSSPFSSWFTWRDGTYWRHYNT